MLSKLKFVLAGVGVALFASASAQAATWSLTPGTGGEFATVANLTLGSGTGTNDGTSYGSTPGGTPAGNLGDTGFTTSGGGLSSSSTPVYQDIDHYFWGLEVIVPPDNQTAAFNFDPLSASPAYWNGPVNIVLYNTGGAVSYIGGGTVISPGSVYTYALTAGYYVIDLFADCRSKSEALPGSPTSYCDSSTPVVGEAGGSPTVGFTLTAVPVPPAILLFASGLVGLVGVGRRRMKARAAAA